MKNAQPTRRDFHQLTLAALGGAIAGSMVGCNSEAPQGEAPKGAAVVPNVLPDVGDAPAGTADGPDMSLLLAEKHVCRGLNTCKGKGGCGATKGTNDCAGQGGCATVAHHSCGSQHDCKGQSGCGETAGINSCKGKGGCGVPVMPSAWEIARANFETQMKAQGKTVGAAPAAKE